MRMDAIVNVYNFIKSIIVFVVINFLYVSHYFFLFIKPSDSVIAVRVMHGSGLRILTVYDYL